MGGERDPGREAHVRALARLAQSNGLQAIPENSGRSTVKKLAEDVLALDVSQSIRNQVQKTLDAFTAIFHGGRECQVGQAVDAAASTLANDGGGAGGAAPASKVWKFGQSNYNASHGDIASSEEAVLRQFFTRFVAFLAWLSRELKAEGTSATTERASPLQVHLHAYLHLSQTFRRRGRDALQMFEFGIRSAEARKISVDVTPSSS